jgi:hypothetical protein
MKPNKDLFTNIDTKRQTRVKIENGEFISAGGLGIIGVETTNGKQVIHEIMHVLGIFLPSNVKVSCSLSCQVVSF